MKYPEVNGRKITKLTIGGYDFNIEDTREGENRWALTDGYHIGGIFRLDSEKELTSEEKIEVLANGFGETPEQIRETYDDCSDTQWVEQLGQWLVTYVSGNSSGFTAEELEEIEVKENKIDVILERPRYQGGEGRNNLPCEYFAIPIKTLEENGYDAYDVNNVNWYDNVTVTEIGDNMIFEREFAEWELEGMELDDMTDYFYDELVEAVKAILIESKE